MATQNESIADSEGVSADPLHFALSVCNGIDISKCTGPEECDIYVCKIDACLDTLEKVSPKSVELSNAIHMLDRSLNRILHRKISILTTLLSNQIIANAHTNSHVNNIFSDGGSDSESSSTSNAFHKKSKKNRRSPQKEENASKKIKQSFEYQINTSNRFANLEIEQDHYENQSNLDDEMKDLENQQGLFSHTAKTPSEINLRSFQNSQPGPSTANNSNNANKSRYVPPIYIDNPKNVPQLLDLLSEITKEKITGRMMNNDKLKIFPPTPEAHKAIQNKITQDGMKSHTYELNDEKQIKVVIRGLSKDFDTSVIISHLQNQGFAPTLCHPIRNRQSNTNFNLFLVTLPKIPKSKEIYQIEFIGRMRVTIESLRKKQSPGQCYNCQEYFHHSRLCTRNPRCMKCAGPHRSRECPKPKDTPPKCLHCNGPHTANFTGCPKNPVNRRTFSEAPENAWAYPAIIAKIKMPPTPAVEPNPATQFIPRPVQLASNANPPTQEVFFKQMSQMMSSMMNSLFSQMANYYQMKPPTVSIQ
ncbi:Nucleic-acid-binding protein from transposon X-element [Araneus ventricosus]|uniref:Nucleic-acid-binding protein from transposon X-element n=1 Tax=Araneus ventricosus TaxID=182803 RepID=A0A4Y2S2J5_ARAVE|nr:Nucleic-acid-binding protein from transposon X-element [Araneus ventricosus]